MTITPVERLDTLLRERGLRRTEPRVQVLGALMQGGQALTQAELEKALPEQDRVTIYRTIRSFLEAGILHRIPDPEGSPAFALCATDDCHGHSHYHDHLHFVCTNCQRRLCLDQITIPGVVLPVGFKVQTLNLVAQGLCDQCSVVG